MKTISVLKMIENEHIVYVVIVSEEGKPHNIYCAYKDKQIADYTAECLQFKLNEIVEYTDNRLSQV